MSFKIFDIKTCEPLENEVFLFDANVWIFYHNQVTPNFKEKPYTRFLGKILQRIDEPHVLLPAVILSEVTNRLLKDYYLDKFMKSDKGKAKLLSMQVEAKDFYKKIYRDSQQFYDDRNSIYQTIFSYSPKIELISDDFHFYKIEDLVTAFTDLDFGDWIICKLAENYNATLITHDGDFRIENLPIITNNKDLLAIK